MAENVASRAGCRAAITEHPSESSTELSERYSIKATDSSSEQNLVSASDHNSSSQGSAVVEHSSTEEVLAAGQIEDDVDLPTSTLRAWTIGLLLTGFFGALNMLFQLRSPPVRVTVYPAQIVAYGLGCLWDKCLPDRQFHLCGLSWNLKPGPFNRKELALITSMANASFAHPVGTFFFPILTQRLFYQQNFGWVFELVFALSVQLFGFGLAGLLRTVLVYPTQMVYREAVVFATVINMLHGQGKSGQATGLPEEKAQAPASPSNSSTWSLSRYWWFFLVALCSFIWYWFPGVIFKGLSAFAFITWIWPQNVVINQVFGMSTGLSLLPATLDWTQASGFLCSPLIPPWTTIWNTLAGAVIFFVIVTPAVHFSGLFNFKYLPIWDFHAFDNTQHPYDASRVLRTDLTFDTEKYHAYSPIFLSAAQMVSYGVSFAAITCTIMQTLLLHGKAIWRRFRARAEDFEDVNMRALRKYRSVPWWWFGMMLAITLAMSFCAVLLWDTDLPWWGLCTAYLLPMAFIVPVGMLYAMTQSLLHLHTISDVVAGYVLPGRPLALMLFKAYATSALNQALHFNENLKLGLYMKLAPQPLFCAQVAAAVWCALVQLACLEFLLKLPSICTENAPFNLTCHVPQSYFTSSIIWGIISPRRLFGVGAMYSSLNWFWLIGAVIPVVTYLLRRRYPKSIVRHFNPAIVFSGVAHVPASSMLNYFSWAFVGWVFQKYIHDRHNAWWKKYNYLTSAGLDVGTGFAILMVILGLGLAGLNFPDWWGNTVSQQTLDTQREAILVKLAGNETFGPKTWL